MVSLTRLKKAGKFSVYAVLMIMMVRHEWRQLKLARLQIDLSLAIKRDTDDIQEVNSVAFSHDGTHVVSGSGDQSVRIWDASTGKEVQKLDGSYRIGLVRRVLARRHAHRLRLF
jgi:WD40 repeat protein